MSDVNLWNVFTFSSGFQLIYTISHSLDFLLIKIKKGSAVIMRTQPGGGEGMGS